MARESRCRSVAIVGGGPSGSTLAAFLAKAGVRVALFDQAKRPELVIGESLVPAIIPILRKLGVEDTIRSFSTFKPGATFYLRKDGEEATFFFKKASSSAPYAYNVPRAEFDEALKSNAQNAGAKLIDHRAQVILGEDERLALAPSSLELARQAIGVTPDMIVDATGRARTLSKVIGLSAREGGRRDAALFAHLDQAECEYEGNVHIDLLNQGWSWRIPLPGRVSIGVVAPEKYLSSLGESREEQFDTLLASDPRLSRYASCGTRITKVMKYNNYQFVSHRFFGPNWALVGDSGGFVDPVFSSGLLVSMKGAQHLAEALLTGTRDAMQRYEKRAFRHIAAWQNVVDSFYNGRLLTLVKSGQEFQHTPIGKMVSKHIERHISRVLTGHGIENTYSTGLLNFLLRFGLREQNPGELRIARA